MKAPQRNVHRLLVGLGAASALALGLAHAQTPAPAPARAAASTPPANTPRLNLREIYDRAEAAGYRDLREIELSHGRWEVKAHNAQGERVKLHVDVATGAIADARRR